MYMIGNRKNRRQILLPEEEKKIVQSSSIHIIKTRTTFPPPSPHKCAVPRVERKIGYYLFCDRIFVTYRMRMEW